MERDGVTQGFIHTFLECRLFAWAAFILGLKARGTSEALEFGNIGHWVLSKVYSANAKPNRKTINKHLLSYLKRWEKENPKATEAELELIDRSIGLNESVLPAYFKRWIADFFPERKKKGDTVHPTTWYQTEKAFSVPYVYPDGLIVPLRGRMDGVFEDGKGHLWLLETKTKGRVDEDFIQSTMDKDIQVLLYLYCMAVLFNREPAGVLYNLVRRPQLRQGKSESLKDFLERIELDAQDPKRTDFYFMRFEMAITWHEVVEWKEDFLDPVMLEIREWAEGRLATYLNPDRLQTSWGRHDLYHAVAVTGLNDPSPAVYNKRSVVYPELED
jgi:hypothetical protein